MMTWLHIVCVTILVSLTCRPGQTFLVDDDPAPPSSSSSFQLTYSPSVIKRGITTNVSLLCEHDGNTLSRLGEITRIRIMKQTGSSWDLLVQKKIANDTRINDDNISVTAGISHDSNDTFLEVSWARASLDTFGTYKCDVIGLDHDLNIASESTAPVRIVEQPVTNNDLLSLLLQTREEMAEMNRDMNRHLDAMDREISNVKDQALTQDVVAAWPEGTFALLQPRAGCPVDLAYLGGDNSFFDVHTESSSDSRNQNSYSKAMPLSTVTKIGTGDQIFTFRFCEARRSFTTKRWPSGSYCINKISGKPCPSGFEEGAVTLDLEDSNTTTNLMGNVITDFVDRATLGFCCKTSGSSRFGPYSMRLPVQSPFILYRKGGSCQPVRGMRVSQETITIDTEDNNNGDTVSGSVPDVFIINSSGKPLRFALCYYTKL